MQNERSKGTEEIPERRLKKRKTRNTHNEWINRWTIDTKKRQRGRPRKKTYGNGKRLEEKENSKTDQSKSTLEENSKIETMDNLTAVSNRRESDEASVDTAAMNESENNNSISQSKGKEILTNERREVPYVVRKRMTSVRRNPWSRITMERDLKIRRVNREKLRKNRILTSDEEESLEELRITKEIEDIERIQRKVRREPIESKIAKTASESGSEREKLYDKSKSEIPRRAARRERFQEIAIKKPRAKKIHSAKGADDTFVVAAIKVDDRGGVPGRADCKSVWSQSLSRQHCSGKFVASTRHREKVSNNYERRGKRYSAKCSRRRRDEMAEKSEGTTLEELEMSIAKRIEERIAEEREHEERLKRIQIAQMRLAQLEAEQEKRRRTESKSKEASQKLEIALRKIEARSIGGQYSTKVIPIKWQNDTVGSIAITVQIHDNAHRRLKGETLEGVLQYKNCKILNTAVRLTRKATWETEAAQAATEIDVTEKIGESEIEQRTSEIRDNEVQNTETTVERDERRIDAEGSSGNERTDAEFEIDDMTPLAVEIRREANRRKVFKEPETTEKSQAFWEEWQQQGTSIRGNDP
ncbi:PREDICTED: trichohyalin-like [Trachymyrmex cornetzi]|uniref:trichohyalin-like n=1 Tax=Trachymyrmex cornetzi TaxID=471704 RepID=UPI00084F1345|nr:PREDICTED: trichohyalin-like [Trachymyrmex cornetzi]